MRIGIDLGGTKIEGVVLDDHGATLARLRLPTPRGDYDASLAAIVQLVADLEREAGPEVARASIGIGIPGTVSPSSGLIKNANSTWLIGTPFDKDVAAALGRPVRMANDANCFAVSEARDGAGAGADVVFGVILGTGVGGGIAVHGRAMTGANAIAGEWGHNPLPWPEEDEIPGPLCYCGLPGCIETFLSGPAFARDFALTGGPDMTAAQIAALAEQHHPRAMAALERYESRLARALASVINIVDPDVIVLGGGMSNMTRI
jgi:fructokinase